ncbi:tRNA pseudouridine(55) synthase TruB [Treponema sp. R6D11]
MNQNTKTPQSGLILLNKNSGVTSFEALGEIKRALGTGKVGHTGTLDKFAQGLLLVLTGRALRLTPYFSHCDKQYKGRIHFGVETDTLDPKGDVIAEAEPPSRERVEQALKMFKGEIMQKPPVFSAIHINGQRASKLARSGEAPEMKERPVTIYNLELEEWQPPFADIFVHCSSGTYIRSLARDIALAAGSRAYLSSLIRTKVAGFSLEMADNAINSPRPITKTVIVALGLPWYEVTPPEAENIFHGKPLAQILGEKPLFPQNTLSTHNATDFSAAVFSGETLIAVVEKSCGVWKYGCVL